MSTKPIEYNNFVIQLQGDGFRFHPNIAGKLASFWVVNKKSNIRSVFAFATSLLDFLIADDESEEKILESAIILIKQYIDASKIADLEEYTFEYKNHNFVLVENPSWWIKSLGRSFGIRKEEGKS